MTTTLTIRDTPMPTRWHRALCAAAATLALLSAPWAAAAPCPPQALPPTAEQATTGMRNARDRGFLWRITRDGRDSYLYGTIHIGKPGWIYPGPTVMRALQAADTLALELDMRDADTLQRMQTGLAAIPRATLPAPMQRRLQAQIKKACLPDTFAQAMTPEMLAVTLVALSARNDGLDPAHGIDLALDDLWRMLKKQAPRALESPELQLKLLHGRSPEESRQIVEQSLVALESPSLRRMILRMGAMWSDSSLEDLVNYAQWCDCIKTALDRDLFKRMLDERNPALADGIDALHAGGGQVFAAVGALHMTGPHGLPELMAQRGYRVERVVFPR